MSDAAFHARLKFDPKHLEAQRKIDRYREVAKAMKCGEKPPADLVLEELGFLRDGLVGEGHKLVLAIRSHKDLMTINDQAAMFDALLGHLMNVKSHAPNVMSYIFERWSILEEELRTLFVAYEPIIAGPDGPRNLDEKLLPALEDALGDLRFSLDCFCGVVEQFGLETTDGDEDRPTILSLGQQQYQLRGGPVVRVGDDQDDVLQAFLPNPPKWKGAERLTTKEIECRAKGRTGRIHVIMKALKKGPLGAAIDLPGRKRKGQGYGMRIRLATRGRL